MKNTNRILGLAMLMVVFTSTVMGQKSRGEETDTLVDEREVSPRRIQEYPVEITESNNEPEIFVVVEDMPSFPGGQDSMTKFIAANLVYPVKAKENNIQGRVLIEFVVDEKGKVTNAKVVKGIGSGCDEEALRIVNSMPNWNPGKQRNKPVKVRFVLPIRFQLQ
ncbi:MAG TPA: energy transducer TonB [Bacteroidetes bacterium]|nr:energy transducer TonB [Bacteroidota bacterium]